MNYIIGKNSRLGLALKIKIEDSILISSDELKVAIINDTLSALFKKAENIINCIAITDPLVGMSSIRYVNYEIPLLLNKFCMGRNIGLINFGTVFEESNMDNDYVRSKRQCANDLIYKNTVHLRLNTIYGGLANPISHMFLGQMVHALESRQLFEMTSGVQYREYHSYDAIAKYVADNLGVLVTGIHDLSSGDGIRLRDLAQYIFQSQNALSLLKLGDQVGDSERMNPRPRALAPEINYINTSLLDIDFYIRRCLSKIL